MRKFPPIWIQDPLCFSRSAACLSGTARLVTKADTASRARRAHLIEEIQPSQWLSECFHRTNAERLTLRFQGAPAESGVCARCYSVDCSCHRGELDHLQL